MTHQDSTLSTPTSAELARTRRLLTFAFGASLAALGALVLGLAGVLVGVGWWPAILGAVLGAGVGRLLVQRGVDHITSGVGAVPLLDAPRLENLVEGLCVTNGIARPRFYVIEIPSRNALAIGLTPRHARLIVTRGLLEDLSRIELEGVVARQLALVKSGQAALASVMAVIARVWPGAPQRLLPARADVIADIEGVSFTRYPPGLLEALAKIQADPTVPGVPRWTQHLWIEDPVASAVGRPGPFHSPIDERIATLREL
ncbi:MAG: hypothetical protein ACLFWR_04435 [Acidimicrobiales bacterium]